MAEYKACILGLRRAIDMNVLELLVIGDLDLLMLLKLRSLLNRYMLESVVRI